MTNGAARAHGLRSDLAAVRAGPDLRPHREHWVWNANRLLDGFGEREHGQAAPAAGRLCGQRVSLPIDNHAKVPRCQRNHSSEPDGAGLCQHCGQHLHDSTDHNGPNGCALLGRRDLFGQRGAAHGGDDGWDFQYADAGRAVALDRRPERHVSDGVYAPAGRGWESRTRGCPNGDGTWSSTGTHAASPSDTDMRSFAMTNDSRRAKSQGDGDLHERSDVQYAAGFGSSGRRASGAARRQHSIRARRGQHHDAAGIWPIGMMETRSGSFDDLRSAEFDGGNGKR